jgi:protein lifeguard
MRRPVLSLSKTLSQKKGFLLSVYATLIVQLAITFAIVYGFRNHPKLSNATKQSMWIYLLASLGLILILSFVPMPIWLKIVLFGLFAVVTGGLLHHASRYISKEQINQALTGAIGIFIGMSVLAVILASLGIDLGWLGLILLGALVGLVIASLVMWIIDTPKDSPFRRVMLWIGLVLFSIYITYETNIMLQPWYTQDFVDASISLYLDFINVFTSLLSLGGE